MSATDYGQTFVQTGVLNLAHRGASKHAPENTMPAFALALEMGAHGFELDVQLSEDGVAVVIHDLTLDQTTSGHGPVAQQPWSALQALDAGAHFSPEFAGVKIPTLESVFQRFGPGPIYNIELKTVNFLDHGLTAEVVRLVEDYQLQHRVILSSFNPMALRRAYGFNPSIPRALIWGAAVPPLFHWHFTRYIAKPNLYHFEHTQVYRQLVGQLHQQKHRLNVWTCNDPDQMRKLLDMGVDGIMTDYPDRLAEVLTTHTTT